MENYILEKKLEALEKLVLEMHSKQSQINDTLQYKIDQLHEGTTILKNFLLESLDNQKKLGEEIANLKQR